MAGVVLILRGCNREEEKSRKMMSRGDDDELTRDTQLSLLALLMAAIRKSVVACRAAERRGGAPEAAEEIAGMEIGWPTDVQHVSHVTFDRFQGFVGLPVEFEVEIPGRVPSASASVFGVSAESMQCCLDTKGNSVPIILLLLQERLYSQGGLKAEGIFRINPENSKEEELREQLNKGIVPEDIEVHCLAGLMKAWFRELPEGVLDGLSPEQVLQCNTEEQCMELVQLLHPTQSALLNWAIELMADVVEEEDSNKMNARNIAMVFAPNMTQMSDPLTALMHAVQVMNLLKSLILKVLREREDSTMGENYPSFSSPSSAEMNTDPRENTSDEDYNSESFSPSVDHNDRDDEDFSNDVEEGNENFAANSIQNLTQLSSCREIVIFDLVKGYNKETE